jgi:hypothetical protein
LKHIVKSSCVNYLAGITQDQLRNGVEASNVVIDTTPGTLRDASVGWLLDAWNWLKDHPQIVLDSWRAASFGGWDLSYESPTSPRSRSVVHERFTEDQAFALSIVDASRQTPDDPNFEEADSPDYEDDSALDPNILCDIRGRLPAHVIEHECGLEYTGDESLVDDGLDTDTDVEILWAVSIFNIFTTLYIQRDSWVEA